MHVAFHFFWALHPNHKQDFFPASHLFFFLLFLLGETTFPRITREREMTRLGASGPAGTMQWVMYLQ